MHYSQIWHGLKITMKNPKGRTEINLILVPQVVEKHRKTHQQPDLNNNELTSKQIQLKNPKIYIFLNCILTNICE